MLLRTTKAFFKASSFLSRKHPVYNNLSFVFPSFSTTPDDSIPSEPKKKRKRAKRPEKNLEELEDIILEPINAEEIIREDKLEEDVEREKIWERPVSEKIEETNGASPFKGIFAASKKKRAENKKEEKIEKSGKTEKEENGDQKTNIFMSKQEPITNKIREISQLQSLKAIVGFLEKPQNKILSLVEKQVIFEKVVKLFTLQNIDSRSPHIPHLKEFFEKFKLSLKATEDAKYYVAIFSLSTNKVISAAFEDFFLDCIDEMIQLPKFRVGDLIQILPNLYRFYYVLNIQERHQTQVGKILSMLEDRLDKLSIQNKINLITLMRSSKTYNDKILDFMLYYSDSNFDMLSFEDNLNIVITVLAAKKMTPYELLYRLRIKFNEIYKDLRPFVVLRTLGTFCKMRMSFMERLYENIFKVISDEKVIRDYNQIDSVLILSYINKTKYKDPSLFEKYLKKVMDNVRTLSEMHLKILLLTLADMNYPNVNIYLTIYEHFNLLRLIDDIRKEETLTEFEIKYFKTICDYVISNSDRPVPI